MKEVISRHEFEIIDALAVLAERQTQALDAASEHAPFVVSRIRDMQRGLVDVIASVLMIETSWDRRAHEAVEAFVLFGSKQHVEALLRELGIRVDDPLVPDQQTKSTQGGEA